MEEKMYSAGTTELTPFGPSSFQACSIGLLKYGAQMTEATEKEETVRHVKTNELKEKRFLRNNAALPLSHSQSKVTLCIRLTMLVLPKLVPIRSQHLYLEHLSGDNLEL